MEELNLDFVRQTGRDSVYIVLARVPSFRFEKQLVRSFVREFDDLILNRWAISRSNTLNSACVEWRPVQISPDNVVGLLSGVSDPAGQLFHVELAVVNAVQGKHLALTSADLFWVEGEYRRRFIAALNQASREIDRSCVEPTGRARLEPPCLKA